MQQQLMPQTKPAEARSEASSWQIDASFFPDQGTEVEKLRFLIRYAILAPSNHNTQPWLFDLHNDHIQLVADRRRALPAADPFDRELIISCGAALACLQAAGHAFGYVMEINRLPDPDDEDVLARIALKRRYRRNCDNKILASILNRHTSRKIFDAAPITPEQRYVLDSVMQCAGGRTAWIDDPHERSQLANMSMNADRLQFENSAFLRELAAWVRPQQSHARDGIPAKAIGISGLGAYVAPLLIRTFDLGNEKVARDHELMRGSPGVMVISTPFDEPRDWLACGEGLGFMLLAAERLDLRVSYLNQPCEINDFRFRLGLFDSVEGNPQLVLRLGRGEPSPPTPRRALEDVIRDLRS